MPAPGLKAVEEATLAAEVAEIQKARAKLEKEVSTWVRFSEDLETFTRTAVGMRSEYLDAARAEQRIAVESFQELVFPIRDFAEFSHATAFAQACINRKFPQVQNCCKVYWLNTCTLGYDAVQFTNAALQHLSGLVAADPKMSCILIASPTVGAFGSEYEESSVEEAGLKIKQRLSNPDLRMLCRDIFLQFDPTSVPPQSKRPGAHKFYMAISDQSSGGQLLSVFTKSTLWRRQTVPSAVQGKVTPVQMLPVKHMVDARRDFTTAGGSLSLSKPAARKQWVSGWQVAAAFHDSLWHNTGLEATAAAAWVDVFAYDHSLAECLMRRSKDSACPQQIYVGTVWADMGSRDDARTDSAKSSDKAAECAKVAKWLQTQVRRKMYAHASENIVLVPDWKPLPDFRDTRTGPKITDADFNIIHPAAAKNLPIRSDYMEMMDSRIQSPEAKTLWTKLVDEHNALWNQSGKSWDGKRKAAGDVPEAAKKARLVEPSAGHPSNEKELEDKYGKCITIPFQKGLKLLVPTKGGSLWCAVEQDTAVDDLSQPLALVYGQFQVGEASELNQIFPVVF